MKLTTGIVALVGLFVMGASAVMAARKSVCHGDPFAQVAAYGDLRFGECVSSTERMGEGSGTYRVQFSRSVLRCSILVSTLDAAPGVEITARVLTPDIRAVYVHVSRDGEPRDTTFDLILRCAK